jgi:hypothetical protein
MEPEENSLEDLILRGAVEVASLDDNGNFVYRMTDKAQEIVPELIESTVGLFYEDLKELWVLGFVNINIDEENPMIHIAEKALNPLAVSELDTRLLMTLTFVLKALEK